MRRGFAAGAVVLATLACLGLLLWLNPFALLNQALDWAFDGAPTWAQVKTLVKDPRRHETTSGEYPLRSFAALTAHWAEYPRAKRVVFIGNSQMQTMSLAGNEGRPAPGEKTYFDHLSERFQPGVVMYRLAAGGLSYPEALWYVTYLSLNPEIKPDVIFLQINYQSFWQGGVREGMTALLSDAAFRHEIEAQAQSGRAYADTFREALLRTAKPEGDAGVPAMEAGFGVAWEQATRSALEQVPLFADRAELRVQFYDLLYRIRLYVFRLKPSAARSIGGARLVQSRATLEAIAERCAAGGIKLVLFLAPQNPQVNLFATERDKAAYLGFVQELSRKYGVETHDLAASVPASMWGRYYNSPDPLHLGREGHRQFSETLAPLVRGSLEGS